MSQEAKITRFKEAYEEGCVPLPNRLIVDKNLTDSAFRLLSYFLSNSDSWVIYVSYTRKVLGWGKDKFQSSITLLISLGYVKRIQNRQQGRFTHYDYEFHHKPIFFEENQELKKLVPKPGFPAPVNPTPTNTNVLTNTKVCKGNAPKPQKPPPKNKGIGKELPSSTRKFPRSPKHQEAFEWLMEKNITDEKGIINVNAMSYLSFVFTLRELKDAWAHLEMKKMQSENYKPKSLIAVFRHILNKENFIQGQVAQKNRQLAERVRSAYNWSTLEIHHGYVVDSRYSGKDISLNMEAHSFCSSLENLYNSLES